MAVERIQLRRGSTSEWQAANPKLSFGEPGVEITTQSEIKLKIGDGDSLWNDLPYFSPEQDLSQYYTSSQTNLLVSQAVAALVDSAPSTLNTLNELAEALADDANFSTTILSAIDGKADTVHTHTKSQITDFSHTHTKSDVTDFAHTHTISDVTNLQTSLDGKSDTSHTHLIEDVLLLEPELSNLNSYTENLDARVTALESEPDVTVPIATQTTRGIVYGTSSNTETAPTAIGFRALESDQMSSGFLIGNVALGGQAARSTTTGGSNIAIGYYTANGQTTGSGNTVIGTQAFNRNSTGSYNTIVGNAIQYLGASTNQDANNVMVGAMINANLNGAQSTNCIILGYNAQQSSVNTSNEVTIGNSSISSIRAQVTSITSLSDARDKADISELDQGLDFVNKLKPVRFSWNMRDGGKVGVPDFGFIAQDLVELEDSVEGHDWLQLTLRNNPEKLEATQGRLIPILVNAIKELSDKVDSLTAEIEELKNDR